MKCCVCKSTRWKTKFFKQGFDFVKCDLCGLLRLSPIPSVEQLDEHYSARSAIGNYRPEGAAERNNVNSQLFELIKKYVGKVPRSIFDIGCFRGEFLDIAKAAGCETWGMELQKDAAEYASSNHGGRIINALTEQFAPSDRGLQTRFDAVLASAVIEHLREPETILKAASEMLVDGGIFLIQTPNLESIMAKLMGRYWPCITAPEHIYYFGRSHLRILGKRWGFDEVAFVPHWKTLRVGYVAEQFKYFGREIFDLVNPIVSRLPRWFLNISLPFYGGEMIVVLRKHGAR
jgi:SAM-dependent methyltransferase